MSLHKDKAAFEYECWTCIFIEEVIFPFGSTAIKDLILVTTMFEPILKRAIATAYMFFFYPRPFLFIKSTFLFIWLMNKVFIWVKAAQNTPQTAADSKAFIDKLRIQWFH